MIVKRYAFRAYHKFKLGSLVNLTQLVLFSNDAIFYLNVASYLFIIKYLRRWPLYDLISCGWQHSYITTGGPLNLLSLEHRLVLLLLNSNSKSLSIVLFFESCLIELRRKGSTVIILGSIISWTKSLELQGFFIYLRLNLLINQHWILNFLSMLRRLV